MRVGLLAPPFIRVPPVRYGGTERVVGALADALVDRGHEVTLFASADSDTSARLEPIVDSPVWQDERFAEEGPFWTMAVDRAYRLADGIDIMHNHADYHAYPFARRAAMPTVTTQHWRMDLPEMLPLYEEYAEQPLVAVSDAQRAPLPQANWISTVHHGLPRDLYTPRFSRGSYLAFCGRLSKDKGVHTAIEAAVRAGMPLRIAGQRPQGMRTDEEARDERAYFDERLAPLLRHPLVQEIGEISDAEKQELYAGAAALLFPIDWPEPFGLVLIEALACGTPVIASPIGSVSEVIRDGVTGYLCTSVDEYVRAIDRVGDLDRVACRGEFEERFTADMMAARYEAAYERVVGPREAPLRLSVRTARPEALPRHAAAEARARRSRETPRIPARSIGGAPSHRLE